MLYQNVSEQNSSLLHWLVQLLSKICIELPGQHLSLTNKSLVHQVENITDLQFQSTVLQQPAFKNSFFWKEKCVLNFEKWECFQQHSEKATLQQFSNRERNIMYSLCFDGASFIQNHFVERSVVTRVAKTGSIMSESDLSEIPDSRLLNITWMKYGCKKLCRN